MTMNMTMVMTFVIINDGDDDDIDDDDDDVGEDGDDDAHFDCGCLVIEQPLPGVHIVNQLITPAHPPLQQLNYLLKDRDEGLIIYLP